MAPYLFPYPITGAVTFASLLLDRQAAYTNELAEATVARTRLQVALKTAATTGGDPGTSALAVLEAVQVYLPYLRSIIACLDTDDLLFKGDASFPWRSALTQYQVSAPILSLPSIHAEHLFVLLSYTIALSNYAHAILGALPRFESQPGVGGVPTLNADAERKTTAGLTRAVDLLSQASGVAGWTATHVSPTLEMARRETGGRLGNTKWPLEAGPETFRGLSMILLADAHITAIRKLVLPVLAHSLFAPPGPPLPPKHPSPSLLGKLYLHVAELYTSAGALFTVHETISSGGASRLLGRRAKPVVGPPDTDAADASVIPELKRYLRKESLLSGALAHKWLGVDVGENTKGAGVGEAVAWVKEARKRLSELEDGRVADKMKGLGIGKGVERRKEARKARQGRVDREIADTEAWIAAYTRMNDTVAFQPIPPPSSLITPPGRPIFTAKTFTPPEPKFATLRRSGELGPEEAEAAAKVEDASYAGKGNYY